MKFRPETLIVVALVLLASFAFDFVPWWIAIPVLLFEYIVIALLFLTVLQMVVLSKTLLLLNGGKAQVVELIKTRKGK